LLRVQRDYFFLFNQSITDLWHFAVAIVVFQIEQGVTQQLECGHGWFPMRYPYFLKKMVI